MSDRKYRQHGYQDSGEKAQKSFSSPSPARKDDTYGPRPVHMPGTHSVSRCSQCGTLLTSLSEPLGQCPKCAFELHSCKQCTYFDPSRRFECMQGVPERVPKKTPATNAPSTRLVFGWKSRPRPGRRQSPILRARLSIIYSKIRRTGFRTDSRGPLSHPVIFTTFPSLEISQFFRASA